MHDVMEAASNNLKEKVRFSLRLLFNVCVSFAFNLSSL